MWQRFRALSGSGERSHLTKRLVERKCFFLSVFLYKIALELCYILLIAPNYAKAGLLFVPTFYKFILSYLVTFLLAYALPLRDSLSIRLIKLMFLTSVLPILSYFYLNDQSIIYFCFVSLAFLFLIVMAVTFRDKLTGQMPSFRCLSPDLDRLLTAVFVLSIVATAYLLYYSGGINFAAFNFEKTYILRREKSFAGPAIYLFNWLTKAFLPFLLVAFYFKKNYYKLVIVILLQIMAFMFSAHKAVLLVLFFIFALLILTNAKIWWERICLFYTAGIVLTSAIYLLFDKIMLLAVFPLRFLIMPAQISYMYFDFFSLHEKLYLRETLVGRLLNIPSPYPMEAAVMLSPNQSLHYNTGIMGDAYANGGFFGMLLFIGLLVAIMLLLESFTKNGPGSIIYTYFFCYYVIIWNDISLLTSLVTGGGAIMLILIFLYMNSERKELHTHEDRFNCRRKAPVRKRGRRSTRH